MSEPTCRNSTNDTNADTAGDSGQKATPDTRHLADPREVRQRQPLHTRVRQTRRDALKWECTFVASRTSVHVSPEVSTSPMYTDFFGVVDFGVEGVSIE